MISDSDFNFFQNLIVADQEQLKKQLVKILNKRYETVIESDKYIYAIGNIDIALMAHLDTVFSEKNKRVFCDKEQEIFWSPDGLGADDRAGVYAILEILIKHKMRPHVIFTLDEEIGGVGAQELAKIKNPFENLKYIIQLDRRGQNDSVFYKCHNEEFESYINSFGFETNIGSYSDISFVCPAWGIAGVNLSVGYENEHTYAEYLNFNFLNFTIQKVVDMLKAASNASIFEYKTSMEICDLCGSKATIKSDKYGISLCQNCWEVLSWKN
jgi:hypothetical protein